MTPENRCDCEGCRDYRDYAEIEDREPPRIKYIAVILAICFSLWGLVLFGAIAVAKWIGWWR